MDAIDLWGLFEAIFNILEDRFGRLVAWLVTLLLSIGCIAVLVLILAYLVRY